MGRDDIRLGEYRESMFTNPLLRKASLGKPMQRGFDLPGEHFIYGRPNHCMDGGAQEAMQYCVIAEQNKKKEGKNSKKLNIRRVNYIKKNKFLVEKGLVNAKEQACHDPSDNEAYLIKPPTKVTKSNKPTKCLRNNNVEGSAFGISTRPSTPVFELLEHHYQSKWLSVQQKKQRQAEECDKKAKESNGFKNTQASYHLTKNAKTLKDQKHKQYQKDWQMSKWAKVGAKSETFRSDRIRETSMKTHNETKNTRQGIFGHGIFIE